VSVRADILEFLRDPRAFAATLADGDAECWVRGMTDVASPALAASGDAPLRPSQVAAWEGLASHRAGLVLGPPGTGKTYALSWMALGYAEARRRANEPCRVLVTAFTLNAIGNLLDAVAEKGAAYLEQPPEVLFVGNAPAAGLGDGVEHLALRGRGAVERAAERIAAPQVVVGCTVWTLARMLSQGLGDDNDGRTARIFDLVCMDEASQLVLSQGLMALAALRPHGRVLVAGDDKQLPPVRTIHEQEVDGRRIGGSLYDFLKQANVAEFALEETFRLNAPLTAFPESKFYPGRYRSADVVAERRLMLRDDWETGLEDWERHVLDPEVPVCVLLHDAAPAGTVNPFEVRLTVQLVERFRAAMAPGPGSSPDAFWQQHLAVVSPHRAQNAAIRTALGRDPAGVVPVVETVDRIQGKERDAVIVSYTVADPEFALAEAAFLFSIERFNVGITRARTKLVLLISRRLMEVVPPDEELFDAAQVVREFVFDTVELGEVALPDHQGQSARISIRVRGFDGTPDPERLVQAEPAPVEDEPLPAMTPELEELLAKVGELALRSRYGTAASFELQKEVLREIPVSDLRDLLRLGHVRLDWRPSRYGGFWAVRPANPPQVPFPARPETVRERLEEVIASARQGRLPPFYDRVKRRFVWVGPGGEDVLHPIVEELAREGVVRLEIKGDGETVDWVDEAATPAPALESEVTPVADASFEVLNRLENLEARRINFGVFEAWSSPPEIARALGRRRHEVMDAIAELAANGHVLLDADGRVRSRMAELARELRYVKQRFRTGDASRRPYLVRALKVELKAREKPVRDTPLSRALDGLRDAIAGDPVRARAVAGVAAMLRFQWNDDDPALAGFQARALQRVFAAWHGATSDDAFVVTADTGSGKTEAALLPLVAGAACDAIQGCEGTRAVLVYPRIRLGANQAQRLAGYLAALAAQDGMPTLRLGLQNGQVPQTFDRLHSSIADLWSPAPRGGLSFPFFGCPACDADLALLPGEGDDGADRLDCACGWGYAGWVGTKAGMRARPPHFFLPVTESLHQWQQDSQYGALFGDRTEFAPPRAVLADEIHLYTHIHGSQVGYALRRFLARAALNADHAPPALAIGMSATLGRPASVWGALTGRAQVVEIRPEPDEREPNPRAREYFYFVQPEVESRGKDIAGAATTIQSLMCLAHGMRRRTGAGGGYRGIVFLDSIDKLKRLHGDYQDAEEGKRLASYRTRLYDDDPASGAPRRECCRDPASCDAFRDGECWYFAATDTTQASARGAYAPGRPLTVADRPVFSGTGGRVEEMIRRSDLVFATSSLEVGYDDPDMALVYQHYSPGNLASFIQRKGRGGRGADDRPVTGVTLSPYSPRDSWYFRRPARMLDASRFEVPVNLGNYFVVRGQMLAVIFDCVARHRARGLGPGVADTSDGLELDAALLADADRAVRAVCGDRVYETLRVTDLAEFWASALRTAQAPIAPRAEPRAWREQFPWVPNVLFEEVNLPAIAVAFEGGDDEREETIDMAFDAATPGNVTRRYGFDRLHWTVPVEGRSPWLGATEGMDALPAAFEREGVEALLRALPEEAREEIGADPHPGVHLPRRISLQSAGRMRGADWLSDWLFDPKTSSLARVEPGGKHDRRLLVHHKSRGLLRGASWVRCDDARGRELPFPEFERLVPRALAFQGEGGGEGRTGLTLGRLCWGSDAELRLMDSEADDVPLTQVFVHPKSRKTLLHGYHVETEGVRLHLDSERIRRFVRDEVARLTGSPDGRWHRGQFLRYLIGSGARAAGLNCYEAERAAELLFSAAGPPELREELRRLLRRWDSSRLLDLLKRTYDELLTHHPLLTPSRVERLGASLGDHRFRTLFSSALEKLRSAEALEAYLRSVLVHGLAVRIKQSFVLHGRGEERRVVFHARLPVQFGDDAEDAITVAETGAHGDGTTRTFVENLEAVLEEWRNGGLVECPNTREDALVDAIGARPDRHDAWRSVDLRDPDNLDALFSELGLDPGSDDVFAQGVVTLLFGHERAGHERFAVFDLFAETRVVGARLAARLERQPSTWELTSAVASAAKSGSDDTPAFTRLFAAYQALEDASLEESLSAEARVADQAYRLSGRLCVDGCQGCLHTGSDIVSGAVSEALLSRGLLERFLRSGG